MLNSTAVNPADSALPDSEARPRAILDVAVDVTERQRSEADLKAIETYAQNIVDTVREPLLILDTTLRVRSANRAFDQSFHVSPGKTESRLAGGHVQPSGFGSDDHHWRRGRRDAYRCAPLVVMERT